VAAGPRKRQLNAGVLGALMLCRVGAPTAASTLLVAAGVCAAAAAATATHVHSTLSFSQPRSDLGAASAGGVAVFGGGCAGGSSAGGKTGGSCVHPSAVIDILRPSRADSNVWEVAGGPGASGVPHLSEARGWAAVCSFGPEQDSVAFLGGGSPSGSRALDILSIATGTVNTNRYALDKGRWGTACAATNNGQALIFAGGKVYPRMIGEVLVLKVGSTKLEPAPWAMVEAREDCGAVGWGPAGALFAGGWVSNTEPGNPSVAVDAFDLAGGVPGHYTWSPGLRQPGPTQEWIGAVSWNATTVFLADATSLYEINSIQQFRGDTAARVRPLPAALAASAGIPAARLQQNGVRIPGAVCFYASEPTSALVCWSPSTSSWQQLNCSATHVAGAITSVGSTVLVGGGYDADDRVTAKVDIFAFG
jgi:hypothetical protein